MLLSKGAHAKDKTLVKIGNPWALPQELAGTYMQTDFL